MRKYDEITIEPVRDGHKIVGYGTSYRNKMDKTPVKIKAMDKWNNKLMILTMIIEEEDGEGVIQREFKTSFYKPKTHKI